MIERITITTKESKNTGRRLRRKGYISRNTMLSTDFIKRNGKYSQQTIKKYGETITDFKVIEINTSGRITYWAHIDNFTIKETEREKEEEREVIFKKNEINDIYKVRDKIIFEIEQKAKELLGVIEKKFKNIYGQEKTKDKVVIKCPYTIGAAKNIFSEGVQEAFKALKNNLYYIEYSNKENELDSIFLDD